MPICTIHIISLKTSVPLLKFVTALKASTLKPLTVARVIRWIIEPTALSRDALIPQSQHQRPNIPWDILLIIPGAVPSLPKPLAQMVQTSWTIQAGVPSSLLSSYETTNDRLLHPTEPPPPLTGALKRPLMAESAQGLELTEKLLGWIRGEEAPAGAVSMLNLLAFCTGSKVQYLQYGKAFSESVGSRRGGVAKVVGKVVPGSCSDGCDAWEEAALAHYPSLEHFADMIASEDYQEANQRWRVPSLKDTFILCTSEIDWEEKEAAVAKL